MTDSDYYRHKAHLLRSPSSWSLPMRRLFLVTLPVASIVWLLLILGYGFLAELANAADVLGTFWNQSGGSRTVFDLGAYKATDGDAAAPRGVRPEYSSLFA